MIYKNEKGITFDKDNLEIQVIDGVFYLNHEDEILELIINDSTFDQILLDEDKELFEDQENATYLCSLYIHCYTSVDYYSGGTEGNMDLSISNIKKL